MKKSFLFLVVVLLISFSCLLTGCNSEDSLDMFQTVQKGHMATNYRVVYHKETKVMYAVSSNNVFTLLVDAEGNPLLYDEEIKDNEKEGVTNDR